MSQRWMEMKGDKLKEEANKRIKSQRWKGSRKNEKGNSGNILNREEKVSNIRRYKGNLKMYLKIVPKKSKACKLYIWDAKNI